jgi:biopolymer transport protein TolR
MGASLGGGGGSSRGNHRRYRSSRFTEINVTPFVDVMLVLLIIFMVAAPMMTAGVSVDLPDSRAAALPGQDEPLSVSIKKDGSIYIQETAADVKSLGDKLKAIAGEKTETRIFVRADTGLDYGKVMMVVGEISRAGFTRVALVTDTADERS